jgi:hypothetical protein
MKNCRYGYYQIAKTLFYHANYTFSGIKKGLISSTFPHLHAIIIIYPTSDTPPPFFGGGGGWW